MEGRACRRIQLDEAAPVSDGDRADGNGDRLAGLITRSVSIATNSTGMSQWGNNTRSAKETSPVSAIGCRIPTEFPVTHASEHVIPISHIWCDKNSSNHPITCLQIAHGFQWHRGMAFEAIRKTEWNRWRVQ